MILQKSLILKNLPTKLINLSLLQNVGKKEENYDLSLEIFWQLKTAKVLPKNLEFTFNSSVLVLERILFAFTVPYPFTNGSIVCRSAKFRILFTI